ncbi:DUF1501 domain-containing protein [Nannocystis sp. ILAH1]|uniref:DUF1501 domain-containing protein n=1 Tax=unclassified Nannocystis TaxID=2627009 RepID=UPI00226D988B|nr:MULTISPECIES: DUF1501 domain-containing protein [unclassified Nannocystis]MCY0992632.1 DUF1501 domain-containing protein [Nannocystis sp. ILAH1]MCY1070138.1 DUF1501 domain-containing protein [Nannocystis sp. RBIL2]
MDRRNFFKLMSLAGLAAVSPTVFAGRGPGAIKNPVLPPLAETYGGPLWVFLNAGGGWDPTSLCDPKGSKSPDDPEAMNRAFTFDQIDAAGTIKYPNIGTMDSPTAYQDFFQKHYKRLRVINGLDMQTNGHDSGSRHCWSGRLAEGYPSLAALIAAVHGHALPMSYLSFGGFDDTQGQVARTRSGNTQALARIAYPDRANPEDENSLFHSAVAGDLIRKAQEKRKERLLATEQLPRVQNAISNLYASRTGSNELKKLQQYLPDMLDNGPNPLRRQIQVALAAFRAGITISINLDIGGFDTHGNHDESHIPRLVQILDGLDFLWTEADVQGIGDNFVVLCGSDFGRTPGYNDTNGKDHHSITSLMMMGKGIGGDKVIGGSDERHGAYSWDPKTLKQSESGIHIEPRHVHASLRRLAGIDSHDLMKQFPIAIEKGDEMNLLA